MTCQEAERLVFPYIRDELDGDTVEAFLEHIDSCEACSEELEICFTVDVGLKKLDSGTGAYDIAGDLERKLEDSYDEIKRMWSFRMFKYSAATLGLMGLALTFLVQCRVWWQQGIFYGDREGNNWF